MLTGLLKIQSSNAKLFQKQLAEDVFGSDSTNKRYRDDINMKRPYKERILKEKRHFLEDLL